MVGSIAAFWLSMLATAFGQPAVPPAPGSVPAPGLVIIGNTVFTADALRNRLVGTSPDSAAAIVARVYTDEGYFAVRAERSADTITIAEGSRYAIDSVRVVGADGRGRDDDEFSARRLSGAPYSRRQLDEWLEGAVRSLNRRGYALASASVEGLWVDDERRRVRLQLRVASGDLVRITAVEVRGATATRSSLIVAAAAVEPGTIFTDELAGQVRARLVRLNLFSEVAEPQVYRVDSVAYGLLLNVTDGNPNTFDGVIGYQPGSDGRDGSFTGLVNVVFRNIFGTGRRAALRWQRQTETASLLDVRYGEPFLFGLPLDLDLGYNQQQEETTPARLGFVTRSFNGDFAYGLTDAFTIKLGGALESTIPQTDTAVPCARQLLRASTLETRLGITYDTRSSTVNPTSGVRYATAYAVGARRVDGPSPCDTAVAAADTRQRIELDLETYLPVARQFVLASGLHYGEVRASILEEGDLFRFGGQSTVRGYLEGAVHASRRTWGNLELRLALSETSYAAIFVDAGYFERNADSRREIEQQSAWLYGYGVGAQVETPLGLVRLSYALGRDDSFATGKVFLGLVNQF